MPLLRMVGGGSGTLALSEGKFHIGRAEDNDFQLQDASVSGRHCEVELDGRGNLRVRDLESTNGTFVEGRRITEGLIAPGQTLRLGNVELLFENPEATTQPATGQAGFGKVAADPRGLFPDLTTIYLVSTPRGEYTPLADSAAHERVSATFAPGILLQERYRLERELGRGAMGQVFLARDIRLDRTVAIKVILSRWGEQGDPGQVEEMRRAFEAEAKLGANLNHPAIAAVFDYGFHNGNPFTVFEYIEGETLLETLARRERIPLDEVRLIVAPLAQALDYAHTKHVVHRDLKPANIRSRAQGDFKILDLGLAKRFLQSDKQTGFAGTPAYASPEQATGLPLDGRTDQYALAIIVYELITGKRPFHANSPSEMLRLHREASVPDPRVYVAGVSAAETASTALLRALHKEREQRFPSCAEFAAALGCQMLSIAAKGPRVLIDAQVGTRPSLWWGLNRKQHVALLPDALWCDEDGEIERWPLRDVIFSERRSFRNSKELTFSLTTTGARKRLMFHSSEQCDVWRHRLFSQKELVEREQIQDPGSPEPAPVVLLRTRPNLPLQMLGTLSAAKTRRAASEAALRIRAAALGAHAVIGVEERRLPMPGNTESQISGTAVRATDQAGKKELPVRWFRERTSDLTRKMFWLLLGSLLLSPNAGWVIARGLGISSTTSDWRVLMPFLWFAGEPQYWLAALIFQGWPLLVALVFRALGWPQLIWAAAVSLLATQAIPVLGFLYLWGKSQLRPESGLRLSLLLWIAPALVLCLLGQVLATKLWRARRALRRTQAGLEQHPQRIRSSLGQISLSACAGIASLCLVGFFHGLPRLNPPSTTSAQVRRIRSDQYDPRTFDLPDIGASWSLNSGWREDTSRLLPGALHVFSLERVVFAACSSSDVLALPPSERLSHTGSMELKQESLMFRLASGGRHYKPMTQLKPIQRNGIEWLEMEVTVALAPNKPGIEGHGLFRVHADSARQAVVVVFCPSESWNKLADQVVTVADGFRLVDLPAARLLRAPSAGVILRTNYGTIQPYRCRLPIAWQQLTNKPPFDLRLQRGKDIGLTVYVEDLTKLGGAASLQSAADRTLRNHEAKWPGLQLLGSEDIELSGRRGRLLRFRYKDRLSQVTVFAALVIHSGWFYQIKAETTNPSPANLQLLEEAIGGTEFPKDS